MSTGGLADVTYTQSEAERGIDEFRNFHELSQKKAEEIKTAFSTKLAENGVPGNIAAALTQSFEAEVIRPTVALSDATLNEINKTQSANDTLNEGFKDAERIAG